MPKSGEHDDHTAPIDGPAQGIRQLTDLIVQVGIGELALVTPLVARDQGDAVVLVTQQVLRKVQAHAGEPARAGHLVAVDQNFVEIAGCADAAELPEQLPELLRIADRKIVQRRIAADVFVAGLLAHETHEPTDIGAIGSLLARLPDRCGHAVAL
jgi:hypothetical protein